jgi:argonaute-like protein implicated in RNA metabolism and viral defense
MEITLNEQEINAILQVVGEIPGKYSVPIINMIQAKVTEQAKKGQSVEIEAQDD